MISGCAHKISSYGFAEDVMTISDTAQFGEILKKRRKALHYTQNFLSELSGLSVSFISDVENGKTTVELGKVLLLANLLGFDVELKERN